MRDGRCPAGRGRPSAGAAGVPWAAARPNPLAGHLAHRRQPALHQARAGKPDGAGHDVGEEIGTPCSFPISRTREPRIPLSRRAEAGFSTRARSSGRRPTDLRRTRSGPADARSLRTSAGRVSSRAFSFACERGSPCVRQHIAPVAAPVSFLSIVAVSLQKHCRLPASLPRPPIRLRRVAGPAASGGWQARASMTEARIGSIAWPSLSPILAGRRVKGFGTVRHRLHRRADLALTPQPFSASRRTAPRRPRRLDDGRKER